MALVATMTYSGRNGFDGYHEQFTVYPHGRQQPPPLDATTSRTTSANLHPAYIIESPSQDLQDLRRPLSSRSRASTGSDDGPKPSLPSISKLFDIAHTDRSLDAHAEPAQSARSPRRLPSDQTQIVGGSIPRSFRNRSRSPGVALPPPPPPPPPPPTLPMRADSVIEVLHSPSNASNGSSIPAYQYVTGSISHQDNALNQRNAQNASFKSHTLLSQPNVSLYPVPRFTGSVYAPPPGVASSLTGPSYYTTAGTASLPGPASYQQRPLPSNFPPPPMVLSTSDAAPASSLVLGSSTPTSLVHGSGSSNVWAHHHYISASSQASYPQSPDRYICSTCNKAFSRPSSLKIHSHSHTGEKPFRCPHAGCGKAFSVRSNMKRHERGCHTAFSSSSGHILQHSHLM